jgi:hypothetical protein
MATNNDRTVYRRVDGVWVNKRNGSDRASSTHDTQKEAHQTAKEMIRKAGGGELTTMGVNGQIVSKDTIGAGNDPRKIKDTEH